MSSYTNDEGRHQLRRKPVPSCQKPTDDGDRLAETASEPLLPGDGTSSSREAQGSVNESHWSASDDETDRQLQSRSHSVESRREKPNKQPTEEKDVQTPGSWKRSVLRIYGAWWQEIVCCILSFVALVALVVLLAAFDGRTLPDLPSGITVNTLVALLSTMARTAFVIPVAEGLSQSKWNWFKRKPRPLEDFDVFDQASRGPWGSLCLLLRTKSRLVGILSALLLISGIATSTLTQSAVAYPSRDVSIEEEGSAVATRLYSTNWSNGQLDREEFLTSLVTEYNEKQSFLYSGFIQGVLTPPGTILRLNEPECKTSHCTWPRFSTLALCYKMTSVSSMRTCLEERKDIPHRHAGVLNHCINETDAEHQDITHLIEYEEIEKDPSMTMTLPNGVSVAASRGGFYMIRPGPILSHDNVTTHINNETAVSYFVFHWDRPMENGASNQTQRPLAAEILFHTCVDTYDMAVNDSVVSITRVASHTEMYPETFSYTGQDLQMYHFVTPADEGTNYTTRGFFGSSDLVNELGEAASSGSLYGLSVSSSLGRAYLYYMLQKAEEVGEQGRSTTDQDKGDPIWDAIDSMAHNVATSVTNSQMYEDRARSWMALVNGTAWKREVYVEVRWPWLSMLAAQILFSAMLLAMVIMETAAADVEVVKSSVMAALLAISADEKARLERGGAANEETRRLIPAGIGGELREKDGKWVLGGVGDS